MTDVIKVLDKYSVRKDCLYTENHEWVRKEGEIYIYGISDYAQQKLDALTFAEVPDEGSSFDKGEDMGFVEALKTTEDYYAPFDCEVVEANKDLEEDAEVINDSPYEDGWIVKIKALGEVEGLLSAEDYVEFIKNNE